MGSTFLFVWGSQSGVGGTERRMAEAAPTLGANNRIVSFVRGAPESSALLVLFRASGMDVVSASSWRELAAVWRSSAPDYVVAFGLAPSLVTRILRLVGFRARTLAIARNGLEHKRKWFLHFIDRVTQGLVDRYIANSGAVRRHLLQKGISHDRIRLVRPALGDGWVTPTAARSGPKVVAMVGNSRTEKNQTFGIDVFSRLKGAPRLQVFTDDASELRVWVAEHANGALADRVEFIERRTIGPGDLDAVDVLLHPSISESAPRVVIEARARGCYVVASDVGDTADYLDAADDQLVQGFSVDAYVNALEHALGRPRRPAGLTVRVALDVEQYCVELVQALEISREPRD